MVLKRSNAKTITQVRSLIISRPFVMVEMVKARIKRMEETAPIKRSAVLTFFLLTNKKRERGRVNTKMKARELGLPMGVKSSLLRNDRLGCWVVRFENKGSKTLKDLRRVKNAIKLMEITICLSRKKMVFLLFTELTVK